MKSVEPEDPRRPMATTTSTPDEERSGSLGSTSQESQELRAVLDQAEHGYLGVLTVDGWPSAVPLNFVRLADRVYFHGDHAGEKMEAIAANDRVTFTVVEAGSLIPSYLRHPRSACPATQYYRSVMIRGRARVVETAAEKAEVLQALMEKLQPEGGYEPITARAGFYRKALKGTAVVAIEIERATLKFKFGQNLSAKKRELVRRGLERRAHALDLRTLEWMTRDPGRPPQMEG